MQTTQTIQNAHRLHREGRLAEAERLYNEVLRAEPNHFDALYLLGNVYAQSGRFDAALEALSKALRVRPQSLEAAYSYAVLLHRIGRLDEAIAAYDN